VIGQYALVAASAPSGVEIATEYWDLRLAFWRSFAGALGLRSIALLVFTIGSAERPLGDSIAAVLGGMVVFTVWASVFPRVAAVALTILVEIAAFGGPLVAFFRRDVWLLASVPFDLVAFLLARRAWALVNPYKLARRRARRVRREVRIRAGGGM
jgi:hypothetical protein